MGRAEVERSLETIRRLRLGDLRRLLRARYGHTLPDDDAGRDDLELLLMLSFERHHSNVVSLWAPWMPTAEAERLIASVRSVPPSMRTPSTRVLGKRVRLINADRDRIGIRQIAACDVTEEERVELRKAKRRASASKRRQSVPRQVYEGNSINKAKPWLAEGISRRTWYRRHKGGGTSVLPKLNGNGTSMEPINTKAGSTPVPRQKHLTPAELRAQLLNRSDGK
jgi:hypothetical protein